MNYIEYLLEGNKVKESDLIRLDNDPKKGALIEGDLKQAFDKLKDIIIDFKQKLLTNDKSKKTVPETLKNSSTSTSNKVDNNTIIAPSILLYIVYNFILLYICCIQFPNPIYILNYIRNC